MEGATGFVSENKSSLPPASTLKRLLTANIQKSTPDFENIEEIEDKEDEDFVKPPIRRSVRRRFGRSTCESGKSKDIMLESLQYLSASYIVKHEKKLKNFYGKKFDKAWKMINSNKYSGASLEQCYETVRDLNVKQRLLRGIEDDNITDEIVANYGDETIMLKEKNMFEIVNKDPFAEVELS